MTDTTTPNTNIKPRICPITGVLFGDLKEYQRYYSITDKGRVEEYEVSGGRDLYSEERNYALNTYERGEFAVLAHDKLWIGIQIREIIAEENVKVGKHADSFTPLLDPDTKKLTFSHTKNSFFTSCFECYPDAVEGVRDRIGVEITQDDLETYYIKTIKDIDFY